MINNIKRCFVFASGNSISQGIELDLFSYIASEVTFGINDTIKFLDTTVATFGDWTTYADRFNYYKDHSLVIGRHDFHIGRQIDGARYCPMQHGLILLQGSGKWFGKDSLEKGLYSSVLTGAFTLNLAIRLGFHQIFLLGFDCCEVNGKTHWYEGLEDAGQYTNYEGKPYTGVGKDDKGNYRTSFYNNADNYVNSLWKPFSEELENVTIYNVSLESRISIFPKIGYHSMFKILKENPIQFNQEDVQKEIRQLLKPYNKA